jgi:hypothetical protein
LDGVIGVKGKVNGGVYQFSVPRKDEVTEGDTPVPPAMGTATVINFQPTGGGKAAITGDFVVTGAEVNPMVRALRENGIEVTAIHSHMLDATTPLLRPLLGQRRCPQASERLTSGAREDRGHAELMPRPTLDVDPQPWQEPNS